jgi:16S rRNA (uracil1498-N3)-methyltransferase
MTDSSWLLAPRGTLRDGATVVLDPEEARHAFSALRLRVGDPVVLADGAGSVARAVLRTVASRSIEAEILAVRSEPVPAGGGVSLALGILHSQAMDWAVQKAVEVGVRTFVPVQTERSQLAGRAVRARHDHWCRVARQALKQCRRAWAMTVASPVELEQLLAERGSAGGLVADPDGRSIGSWIDDAPHILLVGPEGGLAPAELELVASHQWPRVWLGPHVLRADTAAVIGAAMLVARNEGFGTSG